MDTITANQVNQTMLLRDSPGPGTGQFVLERFWLADPANWISQDFFHHVQNP
jgi:hypothetical protein